MVRGGGRRRSDSVDSHDSYDSRRGGGRRGRSPPRRNGAPSSSKGSRVEPRGGQRSKYAPTLVTPTNRGGPYYPAAPTIVAQAAPFGSHQLVTYQQQQQQTFQPPTHHQLYTQQQMLSLQQAPGSVPTQHVVSALPVQHVAAPLPTTHALPTAAPLGMITHSHAHGLSSHAVPHHVAHTHPALHQPTPPVVPPADSQIDAAELYRTLCSSNDEVLPAGWEKIVYNGQVIYLDHLNREAHDEHPFKMWSRAFAASQQ